MLKDGIYYWVQWNGSNKVEIGQYSLTNNSFYFVGDTANYHYSEFKFTVLGEVFLNQ